MAYQSTIQLRNEIIFLFHVMFKRTPCDIIITSYINANQDLHLFCTKEQYQSIEKICALKLNAVGIEPWLRTKADRHPLSSKLLLISYLEECTNAHGFQNKHISRFSKFMTCFGAGLKSFFSLMQGFYQKRKYDLV